MGPSGSGKSTLLNTVSTLGQRRGVVVAVAVVVVEVLKRLRHI